MLRHNLNLRSLIAMAHDLAAVVAAWWLAYLFRFNFDYANWGNDMIATLTLDE